MKITVRHNATEIIAELPPSGNHNAHPVGTDWNSSKSSMEDSVILQRLLTLIKAMVDKVIEMDNSKSAI